MATISLAPPLRTARTFAAATTSVDPEGFGRAVKVRTLMGWQSVDRLMAGDLILDDAGNLHELRAIRQQRADGGKVVRIARKGRAPLVVGAGQKLNAADWRTQVIFGQPTACPAGRMVDGAAIRRGQLRETVLFQLQFDKPVSLDLDGAQAFVTAAQ